jgi:hypothetical protein
MKVRSVVPLALVVLALAVNYPLLRRALQSGAPPAAGGENLAEDLPGAAPAGPEAAAATSTFQPALAANDLVDPFLRGAATPTTVEAGSAPRTILPALSLILRTPHSLRAVIDRHVVGVGDALALGVVTAIGATHADVRTPDGRTVRLSLPDARRAGAAAVPSDELKR